MSGLLELAERCEKATPEQQGQLIEQAWDVLAEESAEFRAFALSTPESGFENCAAKFGMALDARAYESAALMLVPEGWEWAYLDKKAIVRKSGSWSHSFGEASTPALALYAAALRARAGQ